MRVEKCKCDICGKICSKFYVVPMIKISEKKIQEKIIINEYGCKLIGDGHSGEIRMFPYKSKEVCRKCKDEFDKEYEEFICKWSFVEMDTWL